MLVCWCVCRKYQILTILHSKNLIIYPFLGLLPGANLFWGRCSLGLWFSARWPLFLRILFSMTFAQELFPNSCFQKAGCINKLKTEHGAFGRAMRNLVDVSFPNFALGLLSRNVSMWSPPSCLQVVFCRNHNKLHSHEKLYVYLDVGLFVWDAFHALHFFYGMIFSPHFHSCYLRSIVWHP